MDSSIFIYKYFRCLKQKDFVFYSVMNRKFISLLIFVFIYCSMLLSQWSQDPYENNYVRTVGYPQDVISDGRGGVLIGFAANATMVIRVDSAGYVHWEPLGIFMGNAIGAEGGVSMVPDGTGGCLAAWTDHRRDPNPGWPPIPDSSDVYIQRVNGDGNVLWQDNGILVSSAGINREGAYPGRFVVPDGDDGVFVFFTVFTGEDTILDGGYNEIIEIYGQHVSYDGELLWGNDGTIVFSNAISPILGVLKYAVNDKSSGAFVLANQVFWENNTNLDEAGIRLFLQRINNAGVSYFQEGGIPLVIDSTIWGQFPEMSSSSDSGTIISFVNQGWEDTYYSDLYIQKIGFSGERLWGENGLVVADSLPFSIPTQKIASDSNGGAYITWTDFSTHPRKVFCRRIDREGSFVWGNYPLLVSGYPSSKKNAYIAPDGEGGIFVLWKDLRNSAPGLYMQRIDSLGYRLWSYEDVAVSLRPSDHGKIQLFSQGGNCYVVWYEIGAGTGQGIFIQQVNANGELGVFLAINDEDIANIPYIFDISNPYPNPFNSNVGFEVNLPSSSNIRIDIF